MCLSGGKDTCFCSVKRKRRETPAFEASMGEWTSSDLPSSARLRASAAVSHVPLTVYSVGIQTAASLPSFSVNCRIFIQQELPHLLRFQENMGIRKVSPFDDPPEQLEFKNFLRRIVRCPPPIYHRIEFLRRCGRNFRVIPLSIHPLAREVTPCLFNPPRLRRFPPPASSAAHRGCTASACGTRSFVPCASCPPG